jgi:group I intron endonuclease
MSLTEKESDDIMKNIKILSNKKISIDTINQKSGIYKIINKVDGKYYVGRSKNMHKRWKTHMRDLLYNRHSNIHLQRAWNKYGYDNFEFIVVEYVDNIDSLLINMEEKYINTFIEDRNRGIDNCYNISETSYGGPSILNNQFRKGIPHNEIDKQKISKGLLGNTNTKGKPISKSHREKIIINSLKKKDNPSYNHKIYKFYNKYTNEYFTGNLYDLCKKENVLINSPFHRVIKGERNHYKGWIYLKN